MNRMGGYTVVAAAVVLLVLLPQTHLAAAGRSDRRVPEIDVAELSFEQIVTVARGTTARIYMWGGSEAVNSWIDQYVIPEVGRRYGVTLERVPMDAAVFVNRLRAEKEAGRETGSMDLLWINGENFRNARQEELLWGPFASRLPNVSLVDPALAEMDSGFPVEGYSVPWGRAQFNFDIDTARIAAPPASFQELPEWVRRHPGRFTYPEPRDFTGSAFIRQAFIALSGGVAQFLPGYDQQLLDRNAPVLWEYLNEIAPYLWQQGESYPRDLAALDALFQRGEVDVTMSFTQTNAATRTAQGRYPPTVRSFVMQDGSISNTHALAIPWNGPNKAAALVVANFLISPEAQLSKNDPANWGDFTVLALSRLPEQIRQQFTALDMGAATVPLEELERHAVPEIPSEYWEELERRWEAEVRRR